MTTKVIIGISGASGVIYGIRLLERLRQREGVETHLILTRSGEKTLLLETGKTAAELKQMADFSYALEDISCRLASGSYPADGMVIAPCSIHTMSAIANGISSNLMVRAADVTLKERRRLILVVRESPFHLVGLFQIDDAGKLSYRSTYHLRSNDYYSSRNYASRLIGSKLIFYTPLYLNPGAEDPFQSFPAVRRWQGAPK